MMRMKYLWLILFMPVLALSQTLYQGQGNSSDDNPPGLEEAWKYKYSQQGSFQSPYGNLESEIPESYGNSPSRMTVNGKGHATKCRPKEYRQTFELPPEAFADYCEARNGKSYKEEKAKAAMKHYEDMAHQFFGSQSNSHKKHKQIQKQLQRQHRGQNMGGFSALIDPSKYIINSSADLAGALKAAKQGKEIHDHRNGQRACSKCHSNKVAAKKHQEMKEIEKFQRETLKKHEATFQKMLSSTPVQSPRKFKRRSPSRSTGKSRCRSCGRRPASSSGSSGGAAFSSPSKKPDLGYSYSQSKGSSVLINYKPNKDKSGGTHFEWGTNNK